jgi:hypothetical protein
VFLLQRPAIGLWALLSCSYGKQQFKFLYLSLNFGAFGFEFVEIFSQHPAKQGAHAFQERMGQACGPFDTVSIQEVLLSLFPALALAEACPPLAGLSWTRKEVVKALA